MRRPATKLRNLMPTVRCGAAPPNDGVQSQIHAYIMTVYGGTTMLNFSNESSSYDATRHAVHFWGYDGPREVSFFVSEDALRHLQPGTPADKTGLLVVFHVHRDRVLKAAARVYARGRKGSYDIALGDI